MNEINTNNLLVDINLVVPNKYNPKINYNDNEANKAEFEKIKESLRIAGQILPVLVREIENGKYEIINGFHRWSAMQELGYEKIEIKNLGKIDFDTAVSRALLTEDTKIPIDSIELGKLFKTLVTLEKPVSYWQTLLPYNAEVIEKKIEMIDFDFSQYDEGKGGEGDSGESSDVNRFNFLIKDEDTAELCRTALSLADNDLNDAFVELCRSYVELGGVKEAIVTDIDEITS